MGEPGNARSWGGGKNASAAREPTPAVAIQSDVDAGRQPRTRAVKRYSALLLDRDALERFLQRAAQLVPPGDVSFALSVRDGAYAGTFPTLRDLAADPDLSTRLSDVDISVERSEAGAATHELRLYDDDGRATLVALGEEVWAYGALGMLSELLTIYAKPQPFVRPVATTSLHYFSGGFTLALILAAASYRGLPSAASAALICGALWFLIDVAFSEIRLALTPPAPRPLTIEIRSQRDALDRAAARARLWFALRFATIPIWLLAGWLILVLVLPHVPKRW